jgi:hypothetical protein
MKNVCKILAGKFDKTDHGADISERIVKQRAGASELDAYGQEAGFNIITNIIIITVVVLIIIIIIIIIRHELDLDRPVSASSNSLFKGLPSPLRPFGQQFSIIFGILLFILVPCLSQCDLNLLSFSSASETIVINRRCPVNTGINFRAPVNNVLNPRVPVDTEMSPRALLHGAIKADTL